MFIGSTAFKLCIILNRKKVMELSTENRKQEKSFKWEKNHNHKRHNHTTLIQASKEGEEHKNI